MSRSHEMDARVIAGTLRRSPFFAALDTPALAKLGELLETRRFDPDEVLYPPDSDGASMMVLALGQVQFYVEQDGRERVVGTIGPVATFGELGLLLGGPRPLGARAVEEVAVHELTQGTLKMLERSDPELAIEILTALRTRVAAAAAPCSEMLKAIYLQTLRRTTLT